MANGQAINNDPSNAGLFALESLWKDLHEEKFSLQDGLAVGQKDNVGMVAATDAIAIEYKSGVSEAQAVAAHDFVKAVLSGWSLRDQSIRAKGKRNKWLYHGFIALPLPHNVPPVGKAWEHARKIAAHEAIRSAVPLFAQYLPWAEAEESTLASDTLSFAATRAESACEPWHYETMAVDAAHEIFEIENIEPGENITVAVIDTGYTEHREILGSLTRKAEDPTIIDGINLMEPGEPPLDPLKGRFPFRNPSHGTGVMSVIASPKGASEGQDENDACVNGIAPAANVMPVRVTNSVVILIPNKLVDGILQSVDRGDVDVINISLGVGYTWKGLRAAIRHATNQGIIVVGASGNGVPTTVYPAAYPEVLAAAACTKHGNPWHVSSRGLSVDVMAPGAQVCRAYSERAQDDGELIIRTVAPGSGTTFGAACCSGLAALWLSKHGGRQSIADNKYGGDLSYVSKAFHHLIRNTVSPVNRPVYRALYGEGIPNAEALLKADFPSKRKLDDDPNFRAFLSGVTVFGIDTTSEEMLVVENEVLAQDVVLEGIRTLIGRDIDHQASADFATELAFHFASRPELYQHLQGRLTTKKGSHLRQVFVEDTLISDALRQRLSQLQETDEFPVKREGLQNGEVSSTSLSRIEPASYIPQPEQRRLRVYALDPSLSGSTKAINYNEITVDIRWEQLQPGPIGEYLEVVDVDPPSGLAYDPINLDDPRLLATDGLEPSEGVPQFHQQMVYAVAMKTIEHFELALGRPVLWASKPYRQNGRLHPEPFVQRLRIYPHATRAKNAYYSPQKVALSFGYFKTATKKGVRRRERVFTCLSYDIIAHETTHALLDATYRYYIDNTNPDVLAFHEAFSDIVALFQHFTHPAVLLPIIVESRGDLELDSPLGKLAVQFGKAISKRDALRSAIGKIEDDEWVRIDPDPLLLETDAYRSSPHRRGSILVSAVLHTFLKIYKTRISPIRRLATNGTGVLPDGAISADLAQAFASEAAKTANHVLNICIRALDYLPPLDVRFGEFLRAIITADYDLVPNDPLHYRVAFAECFHDWGIYPADVHTVSPESLRWDGPSIQVRACKLPENLRMDLTYMLQEWEANSDREQSIQAQGLAREKLHFRTLDAKAAFNVWLRKKPNLALRMALGLEEDRSFEVHTLRPAARIGPNKRRSTMIVVTLTQRIEREGVEIRKGSTVLFNLAQGEIRYIIHRRRNTQSSVRDAIAYLNRQQAIALERDPYTTDETASEPFVSLHEHGDQ